MRASEIIRATLNLIDGINLDQQNTLDKPDAEYANAPHEVTQPIAKIIAGGDDVHHEKHPSDMRSDSVSMYPNQGK